MESDILMQATMQANIVQSPPLHRQWLLSEEESVENEVVHANVSVTHRLTAPTMGAVNATKTVEPIRLKVKRSRKKTATPTKPSPVKEAKQVRKKHKAPLPSAPKELVDISHINAEAGMRRVQLAEATELAGKMYDDLVATRSGNTKKPEDNFDVLRKLCTRKIVIDSLAHELTVRNVLPVTLSTLSNLFAFVYLRVALRYTSALQ
jgi:hypothetical protein